MTVETIATDKNLKAPKNFRNNVDIENFYRFVQENNLRGEAKLVFSTIKKELKKLNKKKSSRGRKKLQ